MSEDNKTNRDKWRKLAGRIIRPTDYGDPDKPAPTLAERFAPREPLSRKGGGPEWTESLHNPVGAGSDRTPD